MERIDGNTWRTDNGNEVRARGLRLTVEFGEKTKAEVLCAVEAVRAENAKLRDLVDLMLSCPMDKGDCDKCRQLNDLCEVEVLAGELGIEVDDDR